MPPHAKSGPASPWKASPAPFPALFRGRFFAARRAALNLAHASGPRSGAPGGHAVKDGAALGLRAGQVLAL